VDPATPTATGSPQRGKDARSHHFRHDAAASFHLDLDLKTLDLGLQLIDLRPRGTA
jgi:hypothetical protein